MKGPGGLKHRLKAYTKASCETERIPTGRNACVNRVACHIGKCVDRTVLAAAAAL